MAAAEITNADAIHPGYGFLAENARFAEICGEHGIKFIGPTPAMINAMGDKITAKETMIKAGVPVVPGGGGLLESVAEAKDMAGQIGYPVILKATAGGGGKGMRVYGMIRNWKRPMILPSSKRLLHLRMMASIWKSLLWSRATSKYRWQ